MCHAPLVAGTSMSLALTPLILTLVLTAPGNVSRWWGTTGYKPAPARGVGSWFSSTHHL
jgi:hypothetical protein